MKRFFLIALVLTLTAFFMQAPVAVIAPSSVVCAQEPEAEPVEAEVPEGEAASVVININTASAEELATLEGIGEKTAQNIVEYREGNGPFAAIEDIKNVKGIGDKKFEKIKENIAVE